MCADAKITMLGKIPLEPKVLIASEKGKLITEEYPDSNAAKVYSEIVTSKFLINWKIIDFFF